MQTKQTETLDEIIFEHRNKDYGAFELRTNYKNRIRQSFLIGVSAFLALTITTYIFANHSKKLIYESVPIDLTPIKHEEEKPEIPKEIEKIEPPKEVQKSTIQYLPPVPVEDNIEIEETPPPKFDEMEGRQISTTTNEGTMDETIFSAPPAETPTAETIITEIKENNSVFTSVEVNPSFVGGMSEMYKFLAKNINYPTQAQRANIEGKVILSFIVEKDGSITAIDVLKGIAFGCDEEAIRVVKLMPKWNVGKQNGNPVRVKFTIPIFYKLDN